MTTKATNQALGNGKRQAKPTPFPKPATPALPGRLLRPDEVAARLTVSIITVRRLIKAGDLKAIKVGKALRIRPDDLDDYLRRSVVEVKADQ